MLQPNQSQTTYDVAQLLKNENGSFLVQRAGQIALVEAQEGHSIKSWTPVGCIESSQVPQGTNPPYTVTRIDNLQQEMGSSRQGRFQAA